MKYKHYQVAKAETEFKLGAGKKYKVVTIHWEYAVERGKKNYSKVHKNEYIWTLRYLIKWIYENEREGIPEDIISIEPTEETITY